MRTKAWQGLGLYVLTALTIVVMVLLLNSCAFDLNDILGIRKTVVKPSPPPTAVRITYNGNGNDSGTAPQNDHEYKPGEIVMIMANTGGLGLIGRTFAGWNTKQDGSGIGYEAPIRSPGGFAAGDRDVTLYAVWSKDVYIRAGETYTGAIRGSAVHIAQGGLWDMKGNSTVLYLDVEGISIEGKNIVTDSIRGNGYNIYFNEDLEQNNIFGLKTYGLPGGGKLMPMLPYDVEASINAIHYIDGTSKNCLDEEMAIDESCLNRSGIFVKNGGFAKIKHSTITASSLDTALEWSPDAAERWGLGSALYSCFTGVLAADGVKITIKGEASAGAYASYLGYLKLINSSILCNDAGGKGRGVQVSYGGRMDLENVTIETQTENGFVLTTGPGGGTIRAKNITGVVRGKDSACISAGEYGEIYVEGSNLRSENGSAIVISEGGDTTVKGGALSSGATAIKIHPSGKNVSTTGTGTFINTRISSGGDAFYFDGMSAEITVQDGTAIEFPKGCKLIKADSKKGAEQGLTKKSEPVKGSFTAMNVTLQGDVNVSEDGTVFKLLLREGTSYKGAVFGASVSIDDTSEWTVTETCIIAGIDSFSASHITCPKGMRVYYDASINDVGTVKLNGGGELAPIQGS
jgi:hypothetical protein